MKPNVLPKHHMPEAEPKGLRLAFYLLALPGSDAVARVAIDGAQVPRVFERLGFEVKRIRD